MNSKTFTCPNCEVVFNLEGPKLINYKKNLKKKPNMVGPYCNKLCADDARRTRWGREREKNGRG